MPTPASLLCTAVTTVVAGLVLTGCGSDGDAPADAAAPATQSATSSPADSPAAEPTSAEPTPSPSAPTVAPATGPTASCLFTVAQVSAVLGGDWTRTPSTSGPCTYSSDRGAVIATSLVDQPVEEGLRDARSACVPGIEPVTLRDGAFVCLEQHPETSDLVVGNTGARGRLWVAVIPVASGVAPEPQLRAMTALMRAVRS